MSKDRLYLESIRDCLERIAEYIEPGEEVNLNRVWRTVETDFPPLDIAVRRLLQQLIDLVIEIGREHLHRCCKAGRRLVDRLGGRGVWSECPGVNA